jgi:hypothetical protein
MSRGSKGGRKRGGAKQSNGNNPPANKGNQETTAKSANTKSAGRKRGRSKKAKQNPVVFWGNPDSLPTREFPVAPAVDGHAIIESLGRAPISGQEANAAHYFKLVYDRAGGLALALAAAGGLDQPVDVVKEDDD